MKEIFFKDFQMFVLCALLGVLMVFGFYFDPSVLKVAFLDIAFGLCLSLFIIKVSPLKPVYLRDLVSRLTRSITLQRVDPLLN